MGRRGAGVGRDGVRCAGGRDWQTGHSSVGRASDCRQKQPSDGPWLDSGWPEPFRRHRPRARLARVWSQGRGRGAGGGGGAAGWLAGWWARWLPSDSGPGAPAPYAGFLSFLSPRRRGTPAGGGGGHFSLRMRRRCLRFEGTWCSGITPVQHAGGPGFNPQCVHYGGEALPSQCVRRWC